MIRFNGDAAFLRQVLNMELGRCVIKGETAGRFRSLCVASKDLEIARDFIQRCIHDDPESDEDFEESEEANWTAALIRYARAFAIGQPHRWDHQRALSQLSCDSQRRNGRIRVLRDKLYAHPVGLGEDMAVTATVGYDLVGRFVVYGAGIAMTRISSPGVDEARGFIELLDGLIPLVKAMEDEQHALLLAEIRSWTPE